MFVPLLVNVRVLGHQRYYVPNYYIWNGYLLRASEAKQAENLALIKLKNKLSKRLLPINIIDGKLYEGESIFNNDNEIGKVLIDNDYPFALIKYLDKNFDENVNFKTKEAFINIIKPDWVN